MHFNTCNFLHIPWCSRTRYCKILSNEYLCVLLDRRQEGLSTLWNWDAGIHWPRMHRALPQTCPPSHWTFPVCWRISQMSDLISSISSRSQAVIQSDKVTAQAFRTVSSQWWIATTRKDTAKTFLPSAQTTAHLRRQHSTPTYSSSTTQWHPWRLTTNTSRTYKWVWDFSPQTRACSRTHAPKGWWKCSLRTKTNSSSSSVSRSGRWARSTSLQGRKDKCASSAGWGTLTTQIPLWIPSPPISSTLIRSLIQFCMNFFRIRW